MGDEEPSLSASLFGQSVAAKGTSSIIILVLCLFGGGMSYLLYERVVESDRHIDVISVQHTKDREEKTKQMKAEHAAIVEGLRAIKDVNEAISAGLNEQNYIILSDDAERKDIKKGLRRPESLKRKMER